LRDVESALQREEHYRQRLAHLRETERESEKAYQLSMNRYKQGILNLPQALDVERRLYAIRQEKLSVQNSIWQARLDLMLALGGDWLGHPDQRQDTKINGIPVSNLQEDAVRLFYHEVKL
jgi:outer membrane protein TolC